MDGVLKSWAVPKGPSLDTKIKRLAVEVEDHPVEYAKFSGIIPAGNYGAGEVEIWDSGTWEPSKPEDDPAESHRSGRIHFRLHGRKLKGDFILARTSRSSDSKQQTWILRKVTDIAPASPKLPKAKEKPLAPQLCKPSSTIPQGNDWLHELKYDGYRLIAHKRAGQVKLYTRNGHDWTDRFGKLGEVISQISKEDFSIDGEAIVMDAKGRSDFGLLQEAIKSSDSTRMVFAAFDLLDFGGNDITSLPLHERKQRLEKLLPKNDSQLIYSRHWTGHAEADQLFKQACKLKLEGIISKQANTAYLPDSRHSWRKIKCEARQEFIICGYTAPSEPSGGFGALVMGSYEGERLIPRGKVGTGFSEKQKVELLIELKSLISPTSPFPSPPKIASVTWVKPELIAEVKFTELTKDGSIRHGSFIGLREDKAPAEVHLESPRKPAMNKGSSHEVEGIVITNPDREIYPGTGITKMDLANYYGTVAPLILPHLINRPLAFLRAPTGITGQIFFQKHFTAHLPKGVRMRTLKDEGTQVCHITDAAGLLSLVQFGVIEFHPWGSALGRPDKPDNLIWDLDPEASVPWEEVLGAAFLLRDILIEHGLNPVVKTSGGKGLHIMTYCNPQWTWDRLKPFTKAISEELVARNPKRLTIQISKARRTGKIFVDWLRNGRGATCVAPWSVRARGEAPISLPLEWDELPEHTPSGTTITIDRPALPQEWKQAMEKPDSIPASLLKSLGV